MLLEKVVLVTLFEIRFTVKLFIRVRDHNATFRTVIVIALDHLFPTHMLRLLSGETIFEL